MTSSLFLEWFQYLDREMQLQQRKILLFLDNAPSHYKDVSLTNVKLQFLPAKTTSKLQPLDQGIIWNMKVHYHKCLLCKVLATLNADNSPLASTVASSIDVLDCCSWVAAAVREITAATVIHHFAHAGFLFSQPLKLFLSQKTILMKLSSSFNVAHLHFLWRTICII